MIAGPLANNMIDNFIEDSVDEILIIAQELALPVIEDVIDMTNFVETVGLMYNPAPFGSLLSGTGSILEVLFNLITTFLPTIGLGPDALLAAYFDYINYPHLLLPNFHDALLTYTSSFPPYIPYEIWGISQWAGEDLLFGEAKYALIGGTEELPGICSVVYDEMGAYSPEGWWALLTLYDEAKGIPEKEQELADGYGTTWYKLDILVRYYREYYVKEVVPQNLNHPLLSSFFPGAAGMNNTEMAVYFFLNQWANCIIFPDGIDIAQFNIVPGFPSGIKGLEAGYPVPTNMSESAMRALWDINNPYSLVNNEGNKLWRNAVNNEEKRLFLLDEFGLTPHAMDCLITWRVRLTSSIIPIAGGALLGWDTDLTTWINSLTGGLMLFGVSWIILGSSVIYGNYRKRSRNKNLKSTIPKKQVAHQLIKHLRDDVNNDFSR